MRLLWLTERYFPRQGGMAHACDRIVHGLRSAGVEVDLVHLDSRLRRWEVRRQFNGWYLTCPLGRDPAHALQRTWLHIQNHVRSFPPTHIVAFGGRLALQAAPMYAAWLNIPLITLLRGNDWDIGLFTSSRRSELVFALERSSYVCVVSRAQQQQLTALFPTIQTSYIPNGINPDAWQPLPSQQHWATTWREQYAPQQRVIGVFGHLKAKKGVEFFLHALYQSKLASHVRLLFAGTLDPAIFARLTRYPQFNLWYEPFLSQYDLLARYLACDLVALPSFYDGMPNVLLEAASLGIPVLAAATGGIPDVLIDSDFLFTPASPHACIETLQTILKRDVASLQAAGRSLQSHVAEHFSHTLEIQRYLQLFTSVEAAS